MSLRRMRYFVAVAERQSFGRAADDLHVAQSALSRHIAELERSVGARLLDRSPRGVQLTPVGAVLLEDCRRVLAQVQAAFERAQSLAGGLAGQLTIGFSELATRVPCAITAIAPFMQAHPGVKLRAEVIPSVDQLEALRSRQIECGFMIERSTAAVEFEHLAIGSDPFLLVLREDHPLAAKPRLVVADLHDYPYVAISREKFFLAQSRLLTACRARGFQPKTVLEVNSERLQLALVASGVGMSFANSSVRRELPAGLLLRRVEDLDVTLQIDLVWLRHHDHKLVDAFVAFVRAAIA